MTKGVIIEEKKYFCCGMCGLTYPEKEWAEKCEEWCAAHNSCNLEVTRHSLEAKESEKGKGR